MYKLAHLPLPHSKSSPPRPHDLKLSLFTQVRYRCKYKVSSIGPNILEVYIFIYIYIYEIWSLIACTTTQISLHNSSPGSYLIRLFGVRFLLCTGRIPIKYQRTAVQKLFRVHHLVGVERSRDQTKMAERLNGIKTSTNISFKTRNSYRNSASITISCFESLSDSELLLSLLELNRHFCLLFCTCSGVLTYIHAIIIIMRTNSRLFDVMIAAAIKPHKSGIQHHMSLGDRNPD